MTFALAVRTVPARRELFRSLTEDLAAMMLHPSVVSLSVSCDEDVAPNENGCLALESAAARGADWVLFLEDDAGPIDDFVGSTERWLGDFSEPDVHVYPLGSPLGVSNVPAVRWPIAQFYCSVALAIRSPMVPSLVAYLRANAHVRTGLDIMTGHWHRTVSKSPHLIAAQPCLVDHLGDVSTLIDTRPGRNVVGHFARFLGRDYTYEGTQQTERKASNG